MGSRDHSVDVVSGCWPHEIVTGWAAAVYPWTAVNGPPSTQRGNLVGHYPQAR